MQAAILQGGPPLCSCGTTAVVLGMMAGSMPWAPIVAFMVASPLTSPQEPIYSRAVAGHRARDRHLVDGGHPLRLRLRRAVGRCSLL